VSEKTQPAVLKAVEETLREHGFSREGSCFVRESSPVRQMVEPQWALYAPRVTLNLGLAITSLSSVVPWVKAPSTSLMAEAQRWTRLGRITPRKQDRWWSLDEPDADAAERHMLADLLRHGLPWLEREAHSDAFLRFAEARRARTVTELSPEGAFGDLRLSIAVRCWRGEGREARRLLGFAASAWGMEHGRLEHARRDFAESQDLTVLPEAVPDLLAELEALVGRVDRD